MDQVFDVKLATFRDQLSTSGHLNVVLNTIQCFQLCYPCKPYQHVSHGYEVADTHTHTHTYTHTHTHTQAMHV